MDIKDHFVKMAVDMIGKQSVSEIIRYICVKHKISPNKRRNYEKQILSCKSIVCDIENKVEIIKEIPYE